MQAPLPRSGLSMSKPALRLTWSALGPLKALSLSDRRSPSTSSGRTEITVRAEKELSPVRPEKHHSPVRAEPVEACPELE
jgi:hypothetical protein